MAKRLTRGQAIKAKCMDCSGFQFKEVKLCPATNRGSECEVRKNSAKTKLKNLRGCKCMPKTIQPQNMHSRHAFLTAGAKLCPWRSADTCKWCESKCNQTHSNQIKGGNEK